MRFVHHISGKGPEGLSFAEQPDLIPGPGEILVKVEATALNRADILQRNGQYPPPEGESTILGLEMAGTVLSRGPEANRWEVGDHVCALLGGGGYATQVVLNEGQAFRIPQGMSFEQAAAIPEVFLTAFQALRLLADAKAGERLLFHAGASGVGTAAIQLGVAMGLQVFATASQGKHPLCLQLGAAGVIDYRNEDFVRKVLDLTSEQGVDIIIDPVGGPYLSGNLRVLRTDGRLILLALMGGAQADKISLAPVLRKRLQIIGTTLRSRSLTYKKNLIRTFESFAGPKFKAGSLKPVIDTILPWEEVAEAHRRMEANANAGKIVLRVSVD